MHWALWLECSWLLSKSHFQVHKQTSWFNERFDCVDPKGSTLELICTKSCESNSWGRFIVSHPVSTPVLPGFRIPPGTRNLPKTKTKNGPNIHLLALHSALPPVYSQQVETQPRGHSLETPRRAIDRPCHLRWERKTASMKRRSWIQHW